MYLKFFTLLLVSFPSAGEQAKSYPKANLLIEPAELANAIKQKKSLVIIDARPKGDYEAGHVPGAYWLDAKKWAKAFATSQEEKLWKPLLHLAGVQPDRPIVIYDDAKSKDAARIWWILHYWGFDQARLLNGGWKGWQSGEFPVNKQTPSKPEDTELELQAHPKLHATKGDVLDLLKSKSFQILDTRSEGEYCGDVKMARKGGSIPGAKHLEWSEAIDPKTHRFKPANELSKLLKEKGIDLNQPIVTHCQSGGRAAVMAFTLELMGAKDVSNYYRGWSEWGNAEETPVATPKKK